MTLAPNPRVPELIAGVDVRTLPLSALEGFVLSRIDGKSSTTDIVALTGLPQEQVTAILDKLVGLGAIRYRPEGDDAAAAAAHRRADNPTGVHAAPGGGARRRASHGPGQQPRRVFSESAISSPPPELPPQSARPRSPSDWGNPPTSRTHSLPPQASRPPVRPTAAPAGRAGPAAQPAAPANPAPSKLARPAEPKNGTHAAAPGPSAQAVPSSHSERAGGPATTTMGPLPPSPAGASLAPSGLPAPAAYDPRELEEDVDLPRERRKQVLDLFYRLSDIDYYDALGVSYRADKKEIRSAYFALSKLFHPDSMFRKNLGSFKAKMEAVFRFLTEAYETLGKQKNRDEYDAYLRVTKAARMAERALSFEPEVAATAEPLQVPPLPPLPTIIAPPASQSSEPPPLPPREVSSEARKLAQEVIGRRLRGASPTRQPEPPRATPQVPASPASSAGQAGPPAATKGTGFDKPPKTDTQDLLKRLTRTLRDVGQLTGSNDRITRAMRASQAAVARGDLGEATQQAARAASLAPERSELKTEHSRLSTLLSEKLANDYIEQAKFEMKHGKWASAALSWAKVCEGRPNDAGAHRHAAQALLKAGGEMRGAQKYAQKAIFLAPSDIEARILLAQIYLTVGLKLNARRELDAAAKLDPANEMVKNLLADLEKG